jgi:ribonuclease D
MGRARDVIAALAEKHQILAQNLLASEALRRLCWQPPESLEEAAVRARLADIGARPWQIELCAPGLTTALAQADIAAPE